MITTTGSFEIGFGAWASGEDDDPIKGGFVQVETVGFEMSLSLKATPSETDNFHNLPSISFGVSIPAFFTQHYHILMPAKDSIDC
jgi:hypothetical protein